MHLLPTIHRILHLLLHHLWVKFQEFPPLNSYLCRVECSSSLLRVNNIEILSLNGILDEEHDDTKLIYQRHNYGRRGGGFITIIVLALGDEIFEPARKGQR